MAQAVSEANHSFRRGLALFRAGLLTKVWLTIGGFLLLVLAAAVMRSMPTVKVLSLTIDLAEGPTSLAMLVGLVRMAGGSNVVASRTTIFGLGLLLLATATLAEVGLMALGLIHFSRPMFSSHDALIQGEWLNAASQLLHISSLAALLLVFRHLGDGARLAPAYRRVALWIAALWMSLAAIHGVLLARARLVLVPVLMLAALVVAIVALTLYLRLLGRLLRTVERH